MTHWIAFYAVADRAYVLTMQTESFSDAATIQDSVMDLLRRAGVHPELFAVYGPYSQVITEHQFEPLRIVSRLQEIDEALAALDAARERLRRQEGNQSKE